LQNRKNNTVYLAKYHKHTSVKLCRLYAVCNVGGMHLSWERCRSESRLSKKNFERLKRCLDEPSPLDTRSTDVAQVAAEHFINCSVEKTSVYLLTPTARAMIYFGRGARARRATISIQIKTTPMFVTNSRRRASGTLRPVHGLTAEI